jgi:hypothetical protein
LFEHSQQWWEKIVVIPENPCQGSDLALSLRLREFLISHTISNVAINLEAAEADSGLEALIFERLDS